MEFKKNKWLTLSFCLAAGVLAVLFTLVITLARGTDHSPLDGSQIAFNLFSRPVAWYGIMVTLGFCMAITLGCIKLIKYGVSVEPFYYFCFIGIPVAILGARAGSCIIGQTHWWDYWNDFGSGLAIEWGVFFTVIAALIYFPLVFKNERYYVKDYETKSLRRVSMWIIIDSIVPSIFIGQIIGRFGNYFNQELYGPVVTDANTIKWLEIFFPRMCISGVWQEPTFFYEQVGNIIGLCVIYFGMELVTNKKIRTCGNLGIMYFIWYGVVRLIMTPLRMSGGGSGGEHVNLITTILWIVFGITFLFLNMFVFSKYLRNKRIVWFSWISICYLLSGGFRHEISRNKYNFDKSKFIRSPQEMFWYNNF